MEELQRRHEEEQRRKQEEEKDDLEKVVAIVPCELPCTAVRTENDGTVCSCVRGALLCGLYITAPGQRTATRRT